MRGIEQLTEAVPGFSRGDVLHASYSSTTGRRFSGTRPARPEPLGVAHTSLSQGSQRYASASIAPTCVQSARHGIIVVGADHACGMAHERWHGVGHRVRFVGHAEHAATSLIWSPNTAKRGFDRLCSCSTRATPWSFVARASRIASCANVRLPRDGTLPLIVRSAAWSACSRC